MKNVNKKNYITEEIFWMTGKDYNPAHENENWIIESYMFKNEKTGAWATVAHSKHHGVTILIDGEIFQALFANVEGEEDEKYFETFEELVEAMKVILA